MQENNDILLRIKDLMVLNGLNQTQLAAKIEMRQNNLSEILSGKRPIGPNVINKIVISFGINKKWLTDGEGDMYSVKAINLFSPISDNTKKSYENFGDFVLNKINEETRPRIPYTAAAGSLTSAVDGVTADQCEQIPVITAFPSYDYTMIVKGDSMYPNYEGGDEVACKRIDSTSFIQWGKVHVLDTAQGIVIKRVYDADGNIRCSSYNKEYPDFTISKEEVYSMSLVVGMIRL